MLLLGKFEVQRKKKLRWKKKIERNNTSSTQLAPVGAIETTKSLSKKKYLNLNI